jgi:uncharacterized protein (TIGR04255 family)
VSRRPHLDQQPLVEAIFELFAEPSSESRWGSSVDLKAIETALPEYAFHEERLRDLGVHVQFRGGKVQSNLHNPRLRIRRWDEPRQQAVQFGAHMCAHNVLSGAYTTFDDHREVIGRVFRCYLERAEPSQLAWVGQRYINAIQLPADEHDVASYFALYPQLPESLAGGHRELAVQVRTVDFKNGHALVNLSLKGVEGGVATYILDIYARSSGPPPGDPDALLSWQVDAHDAVWKSFELSVTAKSREQLFKERPWP